MAIDRLLRKTGSRSVRIPSLLYSKTLFIALLCFFPYGRRLAFGDPDSGSAPKAYGSGPIQWQEIEPGLTVASYQIPLTGSFIKSEVKLLRADLKRFQFQVVPSSVFGKTTADAQTVTERMGAIAAINTNFFDEKLHPLGLVVSNKAVKQRLHYGGLLLTGIFYIQEEAASRTQRAWIVHRDNFRLERITEAFQAGPRLIAEGKRIPPRAPDNGTRRSGIALTADGQLILYATVLRFPGATLGQIQDMLLTPNLRVVEALNLDGGGSSQLYVRTVPGVFEGISISGGDEVPVFLVLNRRGKK